MKSRDRHTVDYMKLLIRDAVTKADAAVNQAKLDGYSALNKYASSCFKDFYAARSGSKEIGHYDKYIYVESFINRCVSGTK